MYSHSLVEKCSYCLVLEPTCPRRGHHCRDLQPPLGFLFDVETHKLFYIRYYFSHTWIGNQKAKASIFSLQFEDVYVPHTSTNTR